MSKLPHQDRHKVHTGNSLEDVNSTVFERPEQANEKSFKACAAHCAAIMLSGGTDNIIGTVNVTLVRRRRLDVKCDGWPDKPHQESCSIQRDLHHFSSTNAGGGTGAFFSYARFGLTFANGLRKFFYVYVGGGPHNDGDYDFDFQHPACGNLAANKNPGGTKFTFSNTSEATEAIDLDEIADVLFPPVQGPAAARGGRRKPSAKTSSTFTKMTWDDYNYDDASVDPQNTDAAATQDKLDPDLDDEEAPMDQETETSPKQQHAGKAKKAAEAHKTKRNNTWHKRNKDDDDNGDDGK